MEVPGEGSIALGEIHVWHACLDLPAAEMERLLAVLSPDERARADRFRFERDRSRYVTGRGMLRTLVGRYLGAAPERVRIAYGPNQKPQLACGRLHFNLSHSAATAMFAFSAHGEVGIDVEVDSADLARERLAERFFSPGEVAVLRSLPETAQARAFLTCWTRKEAFIKARGDGLSLPLDSFDVSFAPGQPPALLRTAWSCVEPGQWRLYDLSDKREGYIAAVAARGKTCRIRQHQMDDALRETFSIEGKS